MTRPSAVRDGEEGGMTVAALYIDPLGPYPKMADVDCWDATRDARLYDGPWPVVAHPPCGPWSELRHLYRGNEHDCADFALRAVRRFGGVMEHPLRSTYWRRSGIVEPGDCRDAAGGWTLDVNQCDWGHVARKPTRLYFVGVAPSAAGVQKPTKPWHSLRHTFGTELANRGVDIETLRDLMGHKDISTTQRYLHTTRDRKRDAVERLGSQRAAAAKRDTK